jgi:hypothetical protein
MAVARFDLGKRMKPSLTRCFRGVVLGLMLLLAATANFVSISYDNDDDEDTPPVTVELNLAAPVRKDVQLPKSLSSSAVFHRQDSQPTTRLVAALRFESVPQLNAGPPQLAIPLRR